MRYRIHKHYEEAGIKKKASVHTLRHTFSTHQVASGFPLPQLKEILGHRKLETTYKYVHLVKTGFGKIWKRARYNPFDAFTTFSSLT